MTWQEAGRERVCWVDSSGKLVVRWRPIVSEFEDEEETPDPLDVLTDKQRFVVELRYGLRDAIVYSVRDVATLMGLHPSTVHEHEQAALKKLEKVLKTPRLNTPTTAMGREGPDCPTR